MAAKKKPSSKLKIIAAVIFLVLVFVVIGAFLSARDLKPEIAVISVSGEIGINGDSDPSEIVDLIEKAEKDFSVKAIVVEVNSPGGTVVASKEISDAIRATKKPTVALIREIGTSGALWIATSADKVVADPTSITGSIGVTASYLSFEKLMQKYGITYNRIVTGKFKDTGTPYRELTQEEREQILQKMNFVKDIFVRAIAENRNLSLEYVDQLADGGIWLGSEAQELGIVDYLGGEKEAQDAAEKLANITESKLVRFERKRPALEELLSGSTSSVAYWIGKGLGDSLKIQTKDKIVMNT